MKSLENIPSEVRSGSREDNITMKNALVCAFALCFIYLLGDISYAKKVIFPDELYRNLITESDQKNAEQRLRYAQAGGGSVVIRGADDNNAGTAPLSIKRAAQPKCGEDAELIPVSSAEIEIVGQLSSKLKSQYFPFEVKDVSTIYLKLSDNPSNVYYGITNIYGEKIITMNGSPGGRYEGEFSQLLAPGSYCIFAENSQASTIFRLRAKIHTN